MAFKVLIVCLAICIIGSMSSGALLAIVCSKVSPRGAWEELRELTYQWMWAKVGSPCSNLSMLHYADGDLTQFLQPPMSQLFNTPVVRPLGAPAPMPVLMMGAAALARQAYRTM